MNTLRKICSAVLCLALLVSVQPASAAEDVTYNVGSDNVTITKDGTYTITGSTTTNTITVNSDVTAMITLNNVSIDRSSSGSTALDIQSGANVTLILEGTNTLTGGGYDDFYAVMAAPGIHLPSGAALTIQGNGSLTVIGGDGDTNGYGGAGIGGNNSITGPSAAEACGTITILSGTVEVKGGGGVLGGVGIGGGTSSTSGSGGAGGNVTIRDGSVTITGGIGSIGAGGTGIGGGAGFNSANGGAGGTVIITGGTVTVTGGNGGYGGAGIGGGASGSAGGDGGTVVILTSVQVTGGTGTGTGGIDDGINIGGGQGSTDGGNGQGIRPDSSGNYTVYGNPTLPNPPDTYTIPGDATLTIPNGSTLTIPKGVTVTNNGTLNNQGTIENYGTISGTVTGIPAKVPSTVSVNASSTTATYGSTVTLTATVTNATDGSVTFYQGTASGTSLGSDTITSDSNGQAAITVAITDTNGFTTGSNTITAVYSGGTGLLGNSSTTTLTVNAAQLATPSGLSLTSSAPGQATASWGTVTNASGYSVQLYNGGSTVGSAVTVSSGTSHTFDISAGGSYTFTVTATGTGGYSNSTAATSSPLTFYTVTFVNGSTTLETQYVANNGNATLPSTDPTPSDDAQYFAGWVYGADNTPFTSGTQITDNTTVSASFADKTSQTAIPPTWSSSTTDSITINTVRGQRYIYTTGSTPPAITDSGWTDAASSDGTHTFSNLSAPGATYYIWTYLPGGDQTLDSPVSEALTAYTAPKITTNSLDNATVDESYTMKLEATAAQDNTVTWSAEGLPDGLTISSDGIISGTSTTATGDSGTTVTITATISGTQVSSSQQFNLVVNAGEMTGTVTISGDAIFDETLTANYTGNADSVNYQWYRDNAEISGATGRTYTLVEADIGHTISVTATSTDNDYTGNVTSSATTTVVKAAGSVTITSNLDKTYDGEPVNEPQYTSIGGAVSFTWYDEVGIQLSTAPSAAGQYSVTATVAETSTHTSASDTVTFSITKQAQDAPDRGVGYSIDYTAETITVTEGIYELSADSTATSGSSTLDVTPGTDVYIRFKETDTQEASDWTTVTIPSRPAAPQNVRGGTNSISGVSNTMEYRATNSDDWTAITGERVTNLRAGSYLVRFQATDSAFASERASVTVRDYVAPPTTPSEPEKPSGPSTGDSDGWTSILDEILDAEDGDTITIDMNGETEVPGEIFEAVADRNVTVIFEMGDDVSWTLKGTDVPTNTSFDTIDLGVSMNTDGIPVDVINAITGEATSVQITLAHDGDFGFALTLSAPLGKENAGYWANLYHYKVNGGEADREDPLGDDEDTEAMDFETAALIDDDGTANLRMTHASQYAIVIDDHPHEIVLPFTDVNANDWFYDPVVWAYDNGLMTGTSATTFEPNTSTTRAMIVAILNRLEDGPTADSGTFTDVADGDWYAEAVNWAASKGIVAGFEDGTFRPNAPITREQMAAILYNYAQWKGMDVSNRADLSRYSDQPSVWAEEVMQWAVGEGLISGTTVTTLDPQGTATRAQVAAIFERFLSE